MMRLALVGPSHPYRGGIAHYTASLVSAARRDGHEVRLFNFTRQYPGLLFPGSRQTDLSEVAFSVPSQRCIDTLNPWTWLRTGTKIARFGPDLVVFQWWHPYFAPSFGAIARRARRLSRANVVFLCHNVMPHESSRIDRWLLRFAYRSADAYLVQSADEGRKLADLMGGEVWVEVVPHPIYDQFTQSSQPVEPETARRTLGLTAPRVLLFFGLIRPYKGLSVLLEAIPRLQTPDLQLVIAGECYQDAERYHTRIRELGIEDRVFFHDRYIPNEEVATYFSAADAVVLPYLSATGSGIVQIAFAFGVPVIVSGVGGIPDVVEDGHTGLLVPPGNPEALARAIDCFYRDRMADGLRAEIEVSRQDFGWQTVIDALLRVREALSGGEGASR